MACILLARGCLTITIKILNKINLNQFLTRHGREIAGCPERRDFRPRASGLGRGTAGKITAVIEPPTDAAGPAYRIATDGGVTLSWVYKSLVACLRAGAL
jgi:hypothetical protein